MNMKNHEEDIAVGGYDDECALVRKKTWCEKHNCQVNKMTVTSKKWQWIKSKNCYGNVSSRVSKYLCRSKKSGRVEPLIPPAHLSRATHNSGDKALVGRCGSYDVRQAAPNMDERESKLTDGDV